MKCNKTNDNYFFNSKDRLLSGVVLHVTLSSAIRYEAVARSMIKNKIEVTTDITSIES